MVTQELLDEITRRLVEVYNPQAIYLFGSYAWGTPREDSDVDLMVIVDVPSGPAFKRAMGAHRVLRDLKISKDILVYTPQEFFVAAQHPSTLAHKVQKAGVQLYGVA